MAGIKYDREKIDEYSLRAKKQWGSTARYTEYKEKSRNWTENDEKNIATDFMQIFAELGQMKNLAPDSETVQNMVKQLQDYITQHFYNCTSEIFYSLGQMYSADGEFKENIDSMGGTGTAEFVTKAISIYCGK